MVGILDTIDPDNVLSQTQMFHYALIDDAGGRFRIEYDRLHTNISNDTSTSCGDEPCTLNYENERSHRVTVNVTDTGTPPLSRTFTLGIEVVDVNDAPTDLQLCSNTLFENAAPGTSIGTSLALLSIRTFASLFAP